MEVIKGAHYNTDPEQLIQVNEVAKLFHVDVVTIGRWSRGGALPFTTLPSGRRVYSKDWVVEYLANRGQNGGTTTH